MLECNHNANWKCAAFQASGTLQPQPIAQTLFPQFSSVWFPETRSGLGMSYRRQSTLCSLSLLLQGKPIDFVDIDENTRQWITDFRSKPISMPHRLETIESNYDIVNFRGGGGGKSQCAPPLPCMKPFLFLPPPPPPQARATSPYSSPALRGPSMTWPPATSWQPCSPPSSERRVRAVSAVSAFVINT